VIRKVFVIIILSSALAYFLFFTPVLYKKKVQARLIDRLPTADFIGKVNVLELARETSSIAHFHKLPFRDLTSYEFFLSQGKSYGLNLQKPVYIFGNEGGDGGCLIHVRDSVKVSLGIVRLRNSIQFIDTIIEKEKVYYSKKDNLIIHYGSDYLLIYKGKVFNKILNSVVRAKYKAILPLWSRFFRDKHFTNEHIVIYSNWYKFKDAGITTAIFAHDSDSLNFKLKCYLRNPKAFYFKTKETGFAFSSLPEANKSLELHLDISELKNHLDDPLIIEAMKISKQISFPFIDFIKAWEGDLCFVEGGNQTVKEDYIETLLDDNFNTIEVKSYRDIIVPGYSLYFSTNNYLQTFLDILSKKGIMTEENNKYRFLFSPLLSMKKSNGFIQFYSGNNAPRLQKSISNNFTWKDNGTVYRLNIDSLNRNEIFCNLDIPVSKLIKLSSRSNLLRQK